MPRRPTVLLVLALLACSSSVAPAASCVGAVNVDGVLYYGALSGSPVDPGTVSAEAVYEVTRNTGCLDQGEEPDLLDPGESNFLRAGTTLHRLAGHEPTERLVYWSEVIEEWLVLSPGHLTD